MTLADTGPLVALFDPADASHRRCRERLAAIEEQVVTTVPVLTEAFHLLTPDSHGARKLMEFVDDGGMSVWWFDDAALHRAVELIIQYRSAAMDLADASLVVAAERLRARRVFTLDRRDFAIYRIRRGYRRLAFEVLD